MLAACTYVSSSWPPHAFTLSKGHPPCYLQVDGRVSGDLHLLGVDVDDRDSYEGVNDYMQAVVRAIADMLCSNYLGESDFDMQAETSAKPMLDKMVELAPTFRSHADGFLKVVPSLKESYADDDFYGGESFEVVRECAEAFAGLRWGLTSEYDESSGGAGSGVATNGSVPSRAHTCSARAHAPQPRHRPSSSRNAKTSPQAAHGSNKGTSEAMGIEAAPPSSTSNATANPVVQTHADDRMQVLCPHAIGRLCSCGLCTPSTKYSHNRRPLACKE